MTTAAPPPVTESARAVYKRMAVERQEYLDRFEEAAELTLPYLWVETEGDDLDQPWSSLGARGVNNLVNKLLLALLPVTAPFFRLIPDRFDKDLFKIPAQVRNEIEDSLLEVSRVVVEDIKTSTLRVKMSDLLLHGVVSGNALMRHTKGEPRVFHLRNYVVARNPDGTLRKFIIREVIHESALPPELAALAKQNPSSAKSGQDEVSGTMPQEASVDLYTVVEQLPNGNWMQFQELGETPVPDSPQLFPADTLPYIVHRFQAVDGEAYGRSYVEQYMGDLRQLNGLSKALVEGAAVAARMVGLVDPNGQTQQRDLDGAENGDFVPGREQDVSFLQVNKLPDLAFVRQHAASVEQRLGFVFLLNSTVPRQAERVTAEEIRFVAQELDDTLGGVFSLQTVELQLPLVKILLARLRAANRIPEIPEQVRPAIVTGLDAIGRGHDLENLDRLIGGAAAHVGPDAVNARIDIGEYLRRRANLTSVDAEGLVLTDEQVAQQNQQQQALELTGQLGPAAIKELGPQVGGLIDQAATSQQAAAG